MRSYEEINSEISKLWDEADKISDFLMGDILDDNNVRKELQDMQIMRRGKVIALLWVLNKE
jgi:hypothetical protein